jgi:hypothetical protein
METGSMARVVADEKAAAAAAAASRGDGREREWEGDDDIHIRQIEGGGLSSVLQNGQINVLTKGKDENIAR